MSGCQGLEIPEQKFHCLAVTNCFHLHSGHSYTLFGGCLFDPLPIFVSQAGLELLCSCVAGLQVYLATPPARF